MYYITAGWWLQSCSVNCMSIVFRLCSFLQAVHYCAKR